MAVDDTGPLDGPAAVLAWPEYQLWLGGAINDLDDVAIFACRASYHRGSGEFRPLTGASSLAEAAAFTPLHAAADGGAVPSPYPSPTPGGVPTRTLTLNLTLTLTLT
jgi:hypothetical protein